MSDIDTVVMDSLKVLDPNRPIREADIAQLLMFSVLQFATVDSRAAMSLAGATRQHTSRVPPQRFGRGIAQISARQPDISQRPVVEVG